MVRFLFLVTVVLMITIIILLLPIELPFCIDVPGKVIPLKEWVFVRGKDGHLISTIYNNTLGVIEHYAVLQIYRRDSMTFKLHPTMANKVSIAIGDTIGLIYSREPEYQWTYPKEKTEREMTSVSLKRTGEKVSAIGETQFSLMKTLKQSDTNNNQIDWIRLNTRFPEKEIAVREKNLNFSWLTAPIGGRVTCLLSRDTLAIIQDTTRYVVAFPVKWKDRNYITMNQHVDFKIDGSNDPALGTINQIGNTVHALKGMQVFWVKSIVTKDKGNLAPGLIVRCSISCSPVSIPEYVRRIIN